ncbi:MAG: orotate phosphoribosyltransferase [Nevskiales bacterium]
MQDYQKDFLQLALDREVLKLGEFTLKSGRISPYFFNLGLISDGQGMRLIGHCYAQALKNCGIEFDMLFGPAYKGIPLVTAVAMALAEQGQNHPYAYNRKEAKDHGEGGMLVGAPIKGRVVIVDDVMTAGTAVRQAIELVQAAGGEVAAVLIALDRQERATDDTALSAVQTLAAQTCPVHSIVGLEQIIDYLGMGKASAAQLEAIEAYKARYGIGSA